MGLGSIGQRHLRNLIRRFGENLEILAFYPPDPQVVLDDRMQVVPDTTVEERYGAKVFHTLDEALAHKPDIAFICNPSSLHIEPAIRAAKAGCHLFIEKPLSHNLEGVEELKAIAAEKNLVVYVGYMMRFHPVLRLLEEKLRTGSIGRLTSVRVEIGEYMPGWHTYEDYRDTYAARKDLGGGALLSQIHEIDYLYWFFGMPRRMFALGGHLSSQEIDVEDSVEALLEMRHEGRPLPVSLHMDFVQRPPCRFCKIVGEEGVLFADLVQSTLKRISNAGEIDEASFPDFDRNDMFVHELDAFFECIEMGKKPLTDLNDAENHLKIVLEIKAALEQ